MSSSPSQDRLAFDTGRSPAPSFCLAILAFWLPSRQPFSRRQHQEAAATRIGHSHYALNPAAQCTPRELVSALHDGEWPQWSDPARSR